MKVDVSKWVLDYKGAPVIDPANDTPVQLRDVIFQALNSGRDMPAETKRTCFRLSTVVMGSDIVDLSITDAAFIIDHAGDTLAPLGLGRIEEALDPAADDHDGL